MEDLNSIQIFLCVVEKASFTAAARQLGLPKATVSYKVLQLEKKMGLRLLNRSTRAVTPTPDGAAFAERCQPLMQGLTEASQWMSQANREPKGILRIKAPTTFTRDLLSPLLPPFLKEHPQVRIVMTIMDDQKIDLVQQGFDLAISVGANADSSFIAIKIGHSTRNLYASPAYLKTAEKIAKLEDLKAHPCLICAHPSASYEWKLESKSVSKKISVSGPIVSNDYAPLIDGALQGLGVAFLPARTVKSEVEKKKLVRLLPEWTSHHPEFHALIPTTKFISPKVRAFIDFLKLNQW